MENVRKKNRRILSLSSHSKNTWKPAMLLSNIFSSMQYFLITFEMNLFLKFKRIRICFLQLSEIDLSLTWPNLLAKVLAPHCLCRQLCAFSEKDLGGTRQ